MSEKHWHPEFKKYVDKFPENWELARKHESDRLWAQSLTDPSFVKAVQASQYREDAMKKNLAAQQQYYQDPVNRQNLIDLAAKAGKTPKQMILEHAAQVADNVTVEEQASRNAYKSMGKDLSARQDQYTASMSDAALRQSLLEDRKGTLPANIRAIMKAGGPNRPPSADPDAEYEAAGADGAFAKIAPVVHNAAIHWPDVIVPRPRPVAPPPQVQAAPVPQNDYQGTSFDGSPDPPGPEGAVPPPAQQGNDAQPMYAPGTENR